MEMLNTKYQSSMPSSSEEKNFEDEILCSNVPFCDPPPPYMNKIDKGPQRDAKYQISKV